MKRQTPKQEIIRIASLLGSAVILALAFSAYMIYYHSPFNGYKAGQTILSPSVMQNMHYKNQSPMAGGQAYFVFHGIELVYFDTLEHQQRRVAVDPLNYDTFYRAVSSYKSLEPTAELRSEFNQRRTAAITINVSLDRSSNRWGAKAFQLIQLTETDYFRVQLLYEDQTKDQWAYFYQPGIYREVIDLFTKD